MKKSSIVAFVSAIILWGCSAKNPPEVTDFSLPEVNNDFDAYWYAGKGEIAHYDLRQARYGEMHDGEAIFVFVTEDFLLNEQVKFEGGEGDKTNVLKLNAIRRFKTGIYDYSIMRSVFTPVNDSLHPNVLKVSHTAQDWCGHSFTQINLKEDKFKLQQFSYFQNEGDRSFDYPLTMLEDELFSRIRLGDKIPLGKQYVIPALDHVRMKHIAPKPYEAAISQSSNAGRMTTTLSYAQLNRTLSIVSEEAFPHRILSWNEAIRDGGKELVTEAKLTNIRTSAYWSESSNSRKGLREELGIQWK